MKEQAIKMILLVRIPATSKQRKEETTPKNDVEYTSLRYDIYIYIYIYIHTHTHTHTHTYTYAYIHTYVYA